MAQARPRKRGAAPAKKRKRVQIPDDQIRYTNVDMLKRFLSERGKIRARRMTGLSRRQQALAAREIKNADSPSFLHKLQNCPAHAELGIVRMRGDDEDVEHDYGNRV